jgi:hypothetical protein
MQKRNCRRLPAEKDQHVLATKIRKMTDSQLCDFIDEIQNSTRSVDDFLSCLNNMSGTGNGIGRATVAKLKEFALKEGYVAKG